ncbi:hypothetical protein Droror1_Dr00001271 [Drosera rotundifolia]
MGHWCSSICTVHLPLIFGRSSSHSAQSSSSPFSRKPPPNALSLSLTLADTAPSFTASFLNSLSIQRATTSSLLLLKSWPSRRRRSSDPVMRSSDPVMTADEQIITLDVDPDESIKNVKALLEVECESKMEGEIGVERSVMTENE